MVEWKKLGEVCTFCKGRSLSKNDIGFGDAKIILYGELYTTYGDYITDVKSRTSYEKAKLATKLNYGDLVLPISSTTKEAQIGKVSVIKLDGVSLGSDALILRGSFNPEYIMYFLNSKVFEKDKMNCVHGTTIMHLSPQKLAQKVIPIPPLSEQQRIVDILDTFTNSIENLKKQISHRRKQYEYYRDHLLNLQGKEGVEMKTLGEIGSFIRGNGIQKSDFVEYGYACIHYGQIHSKYGFSTDKTISQIDESLYKRCKKAVKGDVVLATTSEDKEGVAKPVVWLGSDAVAVSGDATIYHHCQNAKFMGYQFLTHKFMQFKVKYAVGTKVVRISGDSMSKFEIALPPLAVQERIVSILDQFEASIENLEKQLQEREKQYEYYRDSLLRF